MKKLIAVMAMLPVVAWAQIVPAIDNKEAVEFTETPATFKPDANERRALDIAKKWKASKPFTTQNGGVGYVFGAPATMICTYYQVCAIQLQAGEMFKNYHVGDPTWEIIPTKTGSGANETTLMITRPRETAGKTTLLITTDRRTYIIKLERAEREYIPIMSFLYPDEAERSLAKYRAEEEKKKADGTMKTGVNVSALDFNYRMSGDSPAWKPIRVYSDGTKTYVEFPDDKFAEGMPALVELGEAEWFKDEPTQLVNYRPIGNRMVADKNLKRFALILGIDKQEKKVIIEYAGKQ